MVEGEMELGNLGIEDLEVIAQNYIRHLEAVRYLSRHKLKTPDQARSQGYVQVDPWEPASGGLWVKAELIPGILRQIRDREAREAQEARQKAEERAALEAQNKVDPETERRQALEAAERARIAQETLNQRIEDRLESVRRLGLEIPEDCLPRFRTFLGNLPPGDVANLKKFKQIAQDQIGAIPWQVRREQAQAERWAKSDDECDIKYMAFSKALDEVFDGRPIIFRVFESLPPMGFC